MISSFLIRCSTYSLGLPSTRFIYISAALSEPFSAIFNIFNDDSSDRNVKGCDKRVLKVTNISGSGFAIGENVVGIGTTQNGSDSEYKIFSKSGDDEYDNYAENILVESEADAILDFTEDNPFGDF